MVEESRRHNQARLGDLYLSPGLLVNAPRGVDLEPGKVAKMHTPEHDAGRPRKPGEALRGKHLRMAVTVASSPYVQTTRPGHNGWSESAVALGHDLGLTLLFVDSHPEFNWIDLHEPPLTMTLLPSRTLSGTGRWMIPWRATSRTTGGVRGFQSWKRVPSDTGCRENSPCPVGAPFPESFPLPGIIWLQDKPPAREQL